MTEFTLEQKRAIAIASARARAAADTPPAAPATAPQEPGFLQRSKDRLETGLSDMMSTVVGDTYGHNGDPTQRDNLDPTERAVKALGGDAIPTVTGVVNDAVISGAKSLAPDTAKSIGNAVQAVAQSKPAQAIGRGLDKWRQASPGSYEDAGNLANIAMMLAPVPGPKLERVPLEAPGTGRLTERLIQPDGSFKPITLAAPDTGIGRAYRDWFSSVPFAKGALKEQEAPFLAQAAQELETQQGIFDQQASNLDRHQWHRVNDIEQNAAVTGAALQNKIDAERLGATQMQDAAAASNAQRTVADQIAANAAVEASNKALHIKALKESVPVDRAAAVTEAGHAGFKQALGQVNEAYAEAWGAVGNLTSGTIPAVQHLAELKAETLPADSAAVLKRLSSDAEKLGETDNVSGLDDKIRRLADSTPDYQLQKDLNEIRDTLRLGLPDENLKKLKAVDAVYPNLLANQKAGRAAAGTGGIPSPEQLLTGATTVAGDRRAALGKQPLLDTIYAGRLAEPPPTGATVVPKAPALAKAIALANQKRATASAVRAAKKEAAVIADAENEALKNVEQTGPLARAKEKVATMSGAKSSPHSTAFSALATAGGIGSLLTGGAMPYAATVGAGIGLGRLAVTKPVQLMVAGQLDLQAQRRLANALRSAANNGVPLAEKAALIGAMKRDKERNNAP